MLRRSERGRGEGVEPAVESRATFQVLMGAALTDAATVAARNRAELVNEWIVIMRELDVVAKMAGQFLFPPDG